MFHNFKKSVATGVRNGGAYAVQRSKLFQHGAFPLIKVKKG